MQRGAGIAAASLLFGFLAHALAESAVSLKEIVNEGNTQIREKILNQEWDHTVAEIVRPLRAAMDAKGVPKSEERLHRDVRRADRIQYIRETYNSVKLANMISDAYTRNPYQPLNKVLATFIANEVKAQEAAASRR